MLGVFGKTMGKRYHADRDGGDNGIPTNEHMRDSSLVLNYDVLIVGVT